MTIIDMQVEPLIREAFAGVIGREQERLDAALQALTRLSDADRLHALQATSAVLHVSLFRMANRRPTSQEIDATAEDIVAVEQWLDVSKQDVVTLLHAHVDLRDLSQLRPPEKVAGLLFVVTAALIALCAPEEEPWASYLDDCEDALDELADHVNSTDG